MSLEENEELVRGHSMATRGASLHIDGDIRVGGGRG